MSCFLHWMCFGMGIMLDKSRMSLECSDWQHEYAQKFLPAGEIYNLIQERVREIVNSFSASMEQWVFRPFEVWRKRDDLGRWKHACYRLLWLVSMSISQVCQVCNCCNYPGIDALQSESAINSWLALSALASCLLLATDSISLSRSLLLLSTQLFEVLKGRSPLSIMFHLL